MRWWEASRPKYKWREGWVDPHYWSTYAWLIGWCCGVSKLRRDAWWRHQMETFSGLLAFSGGYSPATGEFPSQRPVTRSFHVFFHLCLKKWLSKQSWGWWFETPPRSLWRHRNVFILENMAITSNKVLALEITGNLNDCWTSCPCW